MPIPETVFNANECQALLDYIERLERHVTLAAVFVPEHKDGTRLTDEEAAAMAKLRDAGKFYVLDEAEAAT